MASVAAKLLISLEPAKENIWNFLGKSLEKLGFSLEKFGIPWKGLEKFGRVPRPSAQRALIPNAWARNNPPWRRPPASMPWPTPNDRCH